MDTSLHRLTILLLVSDPLGRSVFQEILQGEGYVVLPASDLGQAVDWLKESSPELLITRAYVDNMTGHDAAIYLRERCHSMKVLMVGGILDDDRFKHRLALQKFAVFPKPYSAAEMLEKVKQVLREPRG
ncbi:MAG TPA: response regulator [Bryobacteraceae bacterium]|jgi:DNA-binding response OmpR family regulator|nr:response regulator [Bryobacteraceae bacterium]